MERGPSILFLSPISAGFPSPAADYIDKPLDLNEHLIKHPSATFFLRVAGNSMVGAGIFSGDLLVVDRSLAVKQNSVVVAIVNGEFTVKRYHRENGVVTLLPENKDYSPIRIAEGSEFQVWGVVSHVIHDLQ